MKRKILLRIGLGLFLVLGFNKSFCTNGLYKFTVFDIQQGLSNNFISCIYQDKQGYMWLGTREGGINRFDGRNFETFYSAQTEEGLTHNYITSIAEDKSGLIWIGTMGGGINFYDPLSGQINNINSSLNIISYLPSKIIHCLYIDSLDYLWIGSTAGLTHYSHEQQSFKMYPIVNEKDTTLSSYKVFTINELEKGKLLVGTDHGLYYLEVESGKFTALFEEHQVNSLIIDNGPNVWIGTNHGLFFMKAGLLDSGPQKIQKITTLGNEIITTLLADRDQNIWVGTSSKGIKIIDSQGRIIQNLSSDSKSKYALSDHAINSLYIDNHDKVWIGTNSGGINLYNPNDKQFYTLTEFKQNIQTPVSLNSTFLDSKDRLWISTREGLHLYEKYSGKYTVLNIPVNNNITNVSELHGGQIIVGTFGSGLYFFDEKSQTFFKRGFASYDELANEKIWDICSDGVEKVWIATIGNGIYHVNTRENTVEHFLHNDKDERSISNNFVKQIIEDKRGNFWFITNHQGVCMWSPGEIGFIRFLHEPDKSNSLPDNSVDDIFMDDEGNLFFSTFSGLYTFNYSLNGFETTIINQHNQGSYGVKGFNIDHDGYWWISTKNSLIRHNPETSDSWEINDIGIHFGEFKRSTLHIFNNGEMVISGTNETLFFNPRLIKKNPVPPRLAFTDLYINYERIANYSQNSLLPQPINTTQILELNHKQGNFIIGFSCLNFFNQDEINFSYMLDGYDNKWIEAKKEYSATYTNIDPGRYVFRLRAANSDGIWSENDKILTIIIFPPWWSTLIFKIVMVILLISAIGLFVRYRTASLKRRQKYLENLVNSKTRELHIANEELIRKQKELIESQKIIVKKKEQLEQVNTLLLERNNEIQDMNSELIDQKEQLEELSQTKNRFFANISHEFKTPLTLILGPLENLSNRLKNEPDYLAYTDIIARNSKRLLGLINQLLDISRLESAKLSLSPTRHDIIQFTRSIFDSFLLRADKHRIIYKFISPVDSEVVYFDPDKVEKILFNLISNAFKFTPEEGEIEVMIDFELVHETGIKYLILTVKDSGVGIADEKLDKIFDYFTQIGQSTTGIPGSGIGLSIVKQMAEIHKGHVFINSKECIGTTVGVKLRVDETLCKEKESTSLQTKNMLSTKELEYKVMIDDIQGETEIQSQYMLSDDAPYVLIIEDNPDVLLYVKDVLKEDYNILTSMEGWKGFEIAKNMVPDLIICDVMLPDSNGMEVCRKIKEDEITNHVPVIMLTALGSEEHVYSGLESGADNYISKPFNPSFLKMRINNLINTRQKTIDRFKINFLTNELQVTRSKLNEQFVQKLVELIESNIEDPDFSNEDIAGHLNVSIRQLYRKIEGVINLPLNKFIRHVKMKKAREIMQTIPDLTISEIAYKVGYNDPKYFSKCFKQEFGTLPSDFIRLE